MLLPPAPTFLSPSCQDLKKKKKEKGSDKKETDKNNAVHRKGHQVDQSTLRDVDAASKPFKMSVFQEQQKQL